MDRRGAIVSLMEESIDEEDDASRGGAGARGPIGGGLEKFPTIGNEGDEDFQSLELFDEVQ
ncbi:MAG: hypothetical protein J5I99_09755 [Verrucomicrobia bacterium]|nr:hypothetical protein [Kiritimatiellia bacterium]MCO6401495.1 hypothetical protein [Verrucomicrobiota bacterium]